jgi:regulator of protease activity HflC (stomatin/prohibitin superfamily)
MYVIYNGALRHMGFPMPLYFFMSGNKKISTDQLTNNLKRVVQMYVNSAVAENNRLPNSKRDTNDKLREMVRKDVGEAINKILDDIKLEGVSISTSTPSPSSNKVFNLGSYVNDMNAELNQMINDGIPL